MEQRLTTLIEHLPILEQGQRRSHKALAILGTIHVPTGGHNLLMPPTISLCPKLVISNVGECSISTNSPWYISSQWPVVIQENEKKKRKKGKSSSLPDGVPLLTWTRTEVVDRHLPTPAHPCLANISGTEGEGSGRKLGQEDQSVKGGRGGVTLISDKSESG